MRNYRGKRIDNGKWVYGDLFHIGNHCFILTDTASLWIDEDDAFIRGFIEVIPETVGRSIGRKDRDDVEIYEGDKVEGGLDGCIYLVKWNHRVAAYGLVDDGVYSYPDVDAFEWEEIKVVGSIHGPEPIDERKEQ